MENHLETMNIYLMKEGTFMKKKFFLLVAVILVSLATSFMASATSEDFTVHIPSWGNPVNCSTLTKSTDEQRGFVTPKTGTDNANYWIVNSSGNKLADVMYIKKEQVGTAFTLAYKPGMTAYTSAKVTLVADGAAPWSGTAVGNFDAR